MLSSWMKSSLCNTHLLMALNVFPFELVVKLPSDIHDNLETKVLKMYNFIKGWHYYTKTM